MVDEFKAVSDAPGTIGMIAGGIAALGYGLMKVVRIYKSDRKDTAVDDAATSVYDMLVKENVRMAKQMADMSITLSAVMLDRNKLYDKIAELERGQSHYAEMEGQIRALTQENSTLRGKVRVLEEMIPKL